MARLCFLTIFVMSFLILSASGPKMWRRMADPSSMYSPMFSAKFLTKVAKDI